MGLGIVALVVRIGAQAPLNHFPSLLPPKAQLLELRTNNYQLSDELRKNGVGEPRGSH